VSRRVMAAVMALGLACTGAKCGGGTGSGGSPPVVEIESPDSRCAALGDPTGFPPGFDFVPGVPGRVLAATFLRSTLIPLDVEGVPFSVPPGTTDFSLPADADGDGNAFDTPAIDSITVLSSELALVTVSNTPEAVLFVHPAGTDGGMVTVRVEVPEAFDPDDFLGMPDPGPENAELRTGVRTTFCIVPRPGALDSRGDAIAEVIDPRFWCREGEPSYYSTFPAGAAVVGPHMFVPLSLLGGVGLGGPDTQFLPGAVLVYDLDRTLDPPQVSPSTETPDGRAYVLTSEGAFNASEVTPYTSPSGRGYLLVTLTGAIGIQGGATLGLTDGAIDVIDVESLRLVATIPLVGANPAFSRLAIDPTGRVALMGDATGRNVYGIDLAPLDSLVPIPGEVVVLDGRSAQGNAVIFDGVTPLRIPALPGGAPAETCAGRIQGVAFAHHGRVAYAIDECDGSLSLIDVQLEPVASAPLPRDRFEVVGQAAITAPLRSDTLGLPRRPSSLMVRSGEPGVDFQGPDVFFMVGDEEALLCGIGIESPQPAP
jgi:hypothetical protein